MSQIVRDSLASDAVARLGQYMKDQGLAQQVSVKVSALPGGQSNPTFRVEAQEQTFVLRKKPQGQLAPSAHAVDREYRVMHALRESAVPVPAMRIYCEDETIVGTPFYLMDFVQGRSLVDQSLPDMTPSERAQVYANLNQVISALHKVDVQQSGLSDFGRAGNYFSRQINRWSKQYQQDSGERISELESLMGWLPEHIPADDTSCLVHGDYRLDNVILHPVEPRIVAVIDWELSTLGHPLADFSYHCMSWHIAPSLWRGIAGLDLKALGIPEETQYIERYVQATGLTQALEHWDFYLAYNFFRIAAILHGIGQRARQGTAASADALEMAAKAQPLAQLGWRLAQKYDAQRR